MGFVWVHVESFLHSVASPFHSFVPTPYDLASCSCTGLYESMLIHFPTLWLLPVTLS